MGFALEFEGVEDFDLPVQDIGEDEINRMVGKMFSD